MKNVTRLLAAAAMTLGAMTAHATLIGDTIYGCASTTVASCGSTNVFTQGSSGVTVVDPGTEFSGGVAGAYTVPADFTGNTFTVTLTALKAINVPSTAG